jgi:hypothetical protein
MALFSSTDDTADSSLPTWVPLLWVGTIHDATRRGSALRPESYSPECVEEEFSEVSSALCY